MVTRTVVPDGADVVADVVNERGRILIELEVNDSRLKKLRIRARADLLACISLR
jgi:hypothetical protein